MRFADVEQWLGGAILAVWLIVAGLSVAGRVPRAGRLRRSTLVGTGVVAGLLALQAGVVDAVADPDGISVADPPVLQWMVEHRSPAATAFFQAVAAGGGTLGMAVVAGIAALVLALRRRFRSAAVVAAAAIGSILLLNLLKDVYRRPRPPEPTRLGPETTYSLPSGHALMSIVVLGIVATVVVLAVRSRPVRVAVVAGAALGVAVIGLCRLYLGVHWLTDVLDGWLVGGAWLALCVTFLVHGRPPAPRRTEPGGAADGSTPSGSDPGRAAGQHPGGDPRMSELSVQPFGCGYFFTVPGAASSDDRSGRPLNA